MSRRTLAHRILDPEDLGHMATPYLRDEARREVGVPACEFRGSQLPLPAIAQPAPSRRDCGSTGQSKAHSLVESLANVAIGYLVALLSQLAIFPLYGIQVPFTTNLAIGAWFTIVSIARSYALRRWFNRLKVGTERPNRVNGQDDNGYQPHWRPASPPSPQPGTRPGGDR